jgi:hypothetical protein
MINISDIILIFVILIAVPVASWVILQKIKQGDDRVKLLRAVLDVLFEKEFGKSYFQWCTEEGEREMANTKEDDLAKILREGGKQEEWRKELYRILGLLDIQIEMIEAWLDGKEVSAPRKCGVTTAKQAKELIDFISQLLSEREREAIEKVEYALARDSRYEFTFTDIQEILSNLSKQKK